MKSIYLLVLIVLTSGCTVYQINSKDTSQDLYPSKTSIDEVAYLDKGTDKPYTQIAEVTVTTERRQPLEDVIPKLKQEAGMLGADAIMDVRNEPTDFWRRVTSVKTAQRFLSNAYVRTTYTAKAIVFNKSS